MNKSQFIEKLSKELDTSKTTATKIFDAVTKCIAQSLKDTDELRFIGFGTFKTKQTKETEVRTPRGTIAKVPAQRRVSFSIGNKFKAIINGK